MYLYTYIFQEFVVYHPRKNSKIYTNARDNAKNFAANPNTSVYKHRRVPGICVDCKQQRSILGELEMSRGA